jgi:hypothetical protein
VFCFLRSSHLHGGQSQNSRITLGGVIRFFCFYRESSGITWRSSYPRAAHVCEKLIADKLRSWRKNRDRLEADRLALFAICERLRLSARIAVRSASRQFPFNDLIRILYERRHNVVGQRRAGYVNADIPSTPCRSFYRGEFEPKSESEFSRVHKLQVTLTDEESPYLLWSDTGEFSEPIRRHS